MLVTKETDMGHQLSGIEKILEKYKSKPLS